MQKKILLVNALKSVIERDKHILEREGVVILAAGDAGQALEVHRSEKVDLIVADMAGEGGTLCTAIRSDNSLRHVSIVLVCSSPEERAAAEKCGANAMIMRPFRPEALMDRVGELLAVQTRRGYRVLISAEIDAMAGREKFFCTSRNISVTGMLIETERKLSQGQKISCSFFLGTSKVAVESEVVRIVAGQGENQYGLRFCALDDPSRTRIEAFVNQNL